jgi:putative peptidoglycan lipid II flippase
MQEDTPRTILFSLSRFFSGTLLSRITGLGREVVMAAAFGTTPVVASFWMAFRFAHLLRRLFGEGALHVAFVPHFEELRKNNPKEAALFFYRLTSKVTSTLFLLTLFLEMVMALWWAFGGLSEGTAEILKLTMILLPAVIFICLHALNTSLLQCEQSYFLPSVSPVILNLIWIGSVIFFWKSAPREALQWLSMILVFGFALQWLFTQFPAHAYLKENLGPQVPTSKGAIFPLLRPFLLGMLGVAATQINNGLDALFARIADQEGPAILWYALRLQQLPLALLGVGISGALLPPISRAIQKGEMEKAKGFLYFSIRKISVFMIPITAAIFALGYASVNLVYGRGEFSSYSMTETTQALWAYGAGLLSMTLTFVFASAFFAMKDYKTPTFLSLASVGLNIGLNAYFVYSLHLGSISIAFATSLAAFFNAFALGLLLRRKISHFTQGMIPYLLKVVVASGAAFLVTWFVFHKSPLPREILQQLLLFLKETLLFGGIFIGFAYLFKLTEFFPFLNSKLTRS